MLQAYSMAIGKDFIDMNARTAERPVLDPD
jgi:hypothetical protein